MAALAGKNFMKHQKITVCAFIYRGQKMLAVRRAATKKFLPGKFELPGGHVEFGEGLEAALKREVREELHVEIKVGEPFYAFTYLRDHDQIHSIEVDYLAKLKDRRQKIRLNAADHSQYRWIGEKEVTQFYDPADPETAAVKAGFKGLRRA